MIEKDNFVNILENITDYFEKLNKVCEVAEFNTDNFLYRNIDHIVDALCLEFLPENKNKPFPDRYYEFFYDFILNNTRDCSLDFKPLNVDSPTVSFTPKNYYELYDAYKYIREHY